MSEARLWKYVREGMNLHWEAQRIEDKLSSGVPDVMYSIKHHGWIELKYLPKITKGVLSIHHLTAEQRNWIERHGRRTGKVFLLLQVTTHYLLFGHESIRQIGKVSFDEHVAMARAHWVHRINWESLLAQLNAPWPPATAGLPISRPQSPTSRSA